MRQSRIFLWADSQNRRIMRNLPLVSGQGDIQLVVRDVLGREQVVNVPYYSSPTLLRAGLNSFSYEVGAARNNYGLASNDYGPGLFAGTHRFGFTDEFTGEAHAEVLRDQQTVGAGGVWLQGVGVLNAAVSGSRSAQGTGGLLQLGFARQAASLSFGGNARFATANYRQLGMLSTELAPMRQLQGFVSLPLGYRASLSMNYIQQDYRDRPSVHLLSANTGHSIGKAFLSLYAFRPLRGAGSTTVGLNLTVALGTRTSFTASSIHNVSGIHEQDQIQQNLPLGRGFGYRVVAAPGSTDSVDAAATYQNDVGTYTLRAAEFNGRVAESAEVQGGVAFLGGSTHMSRRVDDSFALVQVGDYPNVRVYADNQEVGRTDSAGNVLVPRLRAYERNPVRIEQADLPLDAEIPAIEKDAVPYRRSGLLLDFSVKRSFGAVVSLVLESGAPVPPGAVAQLQGGDAEFPVGLRGETYVTGLSGKSHLHVSWAEQSCDIAVAFVAGADPLPRLGPYVCKSGQP
jgi:outer membrane usher protein